jgi:hypothetical protein
MKNSNPMKTYRVTLFALLSSLALGLYAATSAANGHEHPAEVRVWQENLPDKVVYHYRVINKATSVSIPTVIIGYDHYHGVPTLTARPQTIRSPSGWSGQIISTEETLIVQVEWGRDDNVSNSIQPGTEKRGFAVEVPSANNSYRSFYTLIFGDGTVASGQILADSQPPPGDSTPPTLSVVLTPNIIWPPNGKMNPIGATITVQDDQDPAPVVKLVSITCNECTDPAMDIADADLNTDDRSFSVRSKRTGQRKDGRVYTATYSATDAAGNSTTATATVSIPHDQRAPK